MQKENKVYEVIKQGSQFKIGELILEEDISAETISSLLESGVIKCFEGDLMFDNSSSVNTENV